MATSFQHGEIRQSLQKHGMTQGDLAWLDSFGWNDAAVPPVESDAEAADYARREKALSSSIADLLLVERSERIEGKLAAAIGAQVANWKDPEDEE